MKGHITSYLLGMCPCVLYIWYCSLLYYFLFRFSACLSIQATYNTRPRCKTLNFMSWSLQPRAKLHCLLLHHLLQAGRTRTTRLQHRNKMRGRSSTLNFWGTRLKFPNFPLSLTGCERSWNTASPQALTHLPVSFTRTLRFRTKGRSVLEKDG